MVNARELRRTASVIALASLVALSACSSRWWGEKPVKPGTITANSSSGPACGAFEKILKGADEESSAILECYVSQLDDAWKKVEGQEKNAFSEEEIRALVNRGILDIGANREKALNRLFAVKSALGIEGKVTRGQLNKWIAWARANRGAARHAYRRLNDGQSPILYQDLQSVGGFISALLRQMNWTKDSHELGILIQSFAELRDPELKSALIPALQAGINVLAATCPTLSDKEKWSSREISGCMDLMLDAFKPGAAWIEFVLNPADDLSVAQIKTIRDSLEKLGPAVKSWLSHPALTPLQPARWVELSKRMGANPPDSFTDALRVIRKFNGKSTESTFYPAEMYRFFDMLKRFQLDLFDGMPYYMNALKNRQCADPTAKRWTECVLSDYSVRHESKSIRLALKVKNIRYGQKSAPLTGYVFGKIMLFNALSMQIMEAFDPKGFGVFTTDTSKGSDLVQLLSTGMETYDSVSKFISRMTEKLNDLPISGDDSSFGDNFKDAPVSQVQAKWDLEGFARLLTMSNDILVERTPQEKDVITRFVTNFLTIAPESQVVLDKDGITAVITTLDALSYFRPAYLSLFSEAGGVGGVDRNGMPVAITRQEYRKNLARLMQENFPRTARSCQQFGFDASCGVTFETLVTDSPKGSGVIASGELDILTIIAMGMEGVFDACDSEGRKYRNEDPKLTWNLLQGDDELDCGFDKFRDVAKRLIDSRILNPSVDDKQQINQLLDTLNAFFLTRMTGKIAMIKGDRRLPYLNPLRIQDYGRSATIGSVYALLSDIIDSDQVDVANEKAKALKKRSASP